MVQKIKESEDQLSKEGAIVVCNGIMSSLDSYVINITHTIRDTNADGTGIIVMRIYTKNQK